MNDLSAVLTRHKLDVGAFCRMAEAGIIGERDRIELIDGELIDMAPIGDAHIGTVDWLTQALVLACQGRAVVSVQNPAHLDNFNQPQPDFSIYRYRADFYRAGPRPEPADVLALIEVSDSSLRYDSTVKSKLYAAFGVPEYWIVDIPHRQLIAYRQPGPDGYGEVVNHGSGATLALAAAPEIVLDLDALFP